MLITNIKILIKQLMRNKMYSVVTILGFSISLMFIILLSTYIRQELSVDTFHKNKDRIFSIGTGVYPASYGHYFKENIPEIEDFTRVYQKECDISDFDKNEQHPIKCMFADNAFFNMFSFKILEGNTIELINSNNSIVISSSLSKRLFNNTHVIGKEVLINNKSRFIVSGVMDDFPENTHFKKCDVILNLKSLSIIEKSADSSNVKNDFDKSLFGLYFLAKHNTNLMLKEKQILDYIRKNNEIYELGFPFTERLVPLTDIYFRGIENDWTKANSKKPIQDLSMLALLILIIAIINYVNLSIAQISTRGKEVAIKKLLGSSKYNLFIQFISESVIICFFAFVFAIIFSKIAEPAFNSLLNTNIDIFNRFNISLTLVYLFFILLIGFIAGLIPTVALLRYDAIDVFKGKYLRNTKNIFGKVLISFQFCAAITLIICTLVIGKQNTFIKNYDLGFVKDNIVCIDNNTSLCKKNNVLKNELKRIPEVSDVSFSSVSLLDNAVGAAGEFKNGKFTAFNVFGVDFEFFKIFDIKIKYTGNAYSQKSFFLNQTAVKELGLDSLIQEYEGASVFGIVNDFHYGDLHNKIKPASISVLNEGETADFIIVKLSGKNKSKALEEIKAIFDKFSDGLPFRYRFIDDTINTLYQKEEKTFKTIGYFAFLTIIISIMGILAMTTFYIERRNKEIAIRKVNGALVFDIIKMQNFDIIKWVVLAFIIACPIAYYQLFKWLETFAYKTNLNLLIFVLTGFFVILISIITISVQSWSAAKRNPSESIKTE